jgi:hypothetical protein
MLKCAAPVVARRKLRTLTTVRHGPGRRFVARTAHDREPAGTVPLTQNAGREASSRTGGDSLGMTVGRWVSFRGWNFGSSLRTSSCRAEELSAPETDNARPDSSPSV